MKLYKCAICGNDFHCIGKHVLLSHKMTNKEYYDKYLKKPDEGICPVCGKETPFKKISQGYAAYCCFAHFKESELVKEHRAKTNLEKFGVVNCWQSPVCMKKAAETKQERYGDENFTNREKANNTCTIKYGVKNPGEAPAVKEKIASTMFKHFGGHNMQNAECRSKAQTRYMFEGIKFDSSYEIAFYIYHRDMHHNIKRNYNSFEYECNNKIHRYFPDFMIDDTYYEIKGDHLLTADGHHFIDPHKHCRTAILDAKMECLVKNKIVLVTKHEIIFYIKYVDKKYGKNFIKSFKNKKETDVKSI